VEDLSCQELVELVTDYLEGALPAAERARFDAHLADCPWCAAHLEQVRTTLTLARAAGDAAPLPDVSPILDAFRAWHHRS
jgi:anti-sigma factor RsiW